MKREGGIAPVIASGHSTPTTRKLEQRRLRRCLLMHSKQDDERSQSPCGASAGFKNIGCVFVSFSFSSHSYSVVNHSYVSGLLNRLQTHPMPLRWFDWHVICILFDQWSTEEKTVKVLLWWRLESLGVSCPKSFEVGIWVYWYCVSAFFCSKWIWAHWASVMVVSE